MKDMEVNVHEAKTHFSKLLQRVAAGEEIIIAKAGVPVAKLVPVVAKHAKRKLGLYSGEIWMADDFDAPLPDDILAGFLGEDVEPKKKSPRSAFRRQRKAR
ncbi:MAG TPA: type II toxin-antitoxin system Phd/YefM family antitoxin [Candidatus Angelobacter sp.]